MKTTLLIFLTLVGVTTALAGVNPASAEAHEARARLALSRNDAEQAVTEAEQAVALAPDNAGCQHTLGDAYGTAAQKSGMLRGLRLGKKCLAAYERAVALAPDNADYRYSLFEIYRQAPGFMGGGTDKALAEATALSKLDAARGRLAFAILHEADKKYDLARAELEAILQQSPDNYAALYQTGRLAAITGESLDRGLAALKHCLEIPVPEGSGAPDHAAAQWRLGNILEKKGDPVAARAAYQAALKLNPDFGEAADSLKKLK